MLVHDIKEIIQGHVTSHNPSICSWWKILDEAEGLHMFELLSLDTSKALQSYRISVHEAVSCIFLATTIIQVFAFPVMSLLQDWVEPHSDCGVQFSSSNCKYALIFLYFHGWRSS